MDEDLPVRRRQFLAGVAGLAGAAVLGAQRSSAAAPLTVRDAAAANLAEALDFTSPPNLDAPHWNVPAFTGLPCPAGQYVDYENWHQLAALARSQGWP